LPNIKATNQQTKKKQKKAKKTKPKKNKEEEKTTSLCAKKVATQNTKQKTQNKNKTHKENKQSTNIFLELFHPIYTNTQKTNQKKKRNGNRQNKREQTKTNFLVLDLRLHTKTLNQSNTNRAKSIGSYHKNYSSCITFLLFFSLSMKICNPINKTVGLFFHLGQFFFCCNFSFLVNTLACLACLAVLLAKRKKHKRTSHINCRPNKTKTKPKQKLKQKPNKPKKRSCSHYFLRYLPLDGLPSTNSFFLQLQKKSLIIQYFSLRPKLLAKTKNKKQNKTITPNSPLVLKHKKFETDTKNKNKQTLKNKNKNKSADQSDAKNTFQKTESIDLNWKKIST
jgi:hypothetical protein